MDRQSGVVRHVDGCQGRTPLDGRQPARIAVRHDLERPPFFTRQALEQHKTVSPDRGVDRLILGADRGGCDVGRVDALAGRQRSQRGLDSLECVFQVDRGRSSGAQLRQRGIQPRVRRIGGERETDAVRGGGADQGRTAHDHRADRVGCTIETVEPADDEIVREASLVDHAERSPIGVEPDRAARQVAGHSRPPLGMVSRRRKLIPAEGIGRLLAMSPTND